MCKRFTADDWHCIQDKSELGGTVIYLVFSIVGTLVLLLKSLILVHILK